MALDNPADLFLYELSGMYDAERKSNQMVGEILSHAEQSPLAQILRAQQQQGQQKIQNLETCFAMMEMEPMDAPCMTLDGMRAEFQAFAEQRLPPRGRMKRASGAISRARVFGAWCTASWYYWPAWAYASPSSPASCTWSKCRGGAPSCRSITGLK